MTLSRKVMNLDDWATAGFDNVFGVSAGPFVPEDLFDARQQLDGAQYSAFFSGWSLGIQYRDALANNG